MAVIVRPSFTCTLKSTNTIVTALSEEGVVPVIDDGYGSVFILTAKRGTSDGTGGTITIGLKYDDSYSTGQIISATHTNVAVGSAVSDEFELTGLDFSKCNSRWLTADTNQVDVMGISNYFIWKPEISLNKLQAYRSDGDKNASNTAQFVTVEGSISYDLTNDALAQNIIGPMVFGTVSLTPVGRYRFKVTDGSNSAYSDYAYVTNTGTLDAYQKAKNGIEFSEVVNCSGIDIDSAVCEIESAILTEVGGTVIYEGDKVGALLNENIYLHLSPSGMGMGIGGIPMHGNYAAPALDIHWLTYIKRLYVRDVDMTLDEETISLWTEILGGGLTLSRILSKLGVELSKLGVDFIIESGNNYTKWNSGKAEIWGTSVWDAGSTKRGKTVLYPSAIKLYGTPYSVNVTPNINGSIVNKYFVGNSAANAAKYSDGFEVRAECSTSSYGVTFDYYIVGRWK